MIKKTGHQMISFLRMMTFHRVIVWLRRPLKYKLGFVYGMFVINIGKVFSLFVYPLLLAMKKSRILRSARFHATPSSNNILLAEHGGTRFLVSSKDKDLSRHTYIHGNFDFEKLEEAVKILGNDFTPRTLIDIGANIGVIGIEAIKKGMFEKVIAFEPELNNYRLLVANIFINGLENQIEHHNIALGSEKDEMLKLELSDDNFGDHRIKISSDDGIFCEKNRAVIEVRSSTLDSKVDDISPHDTLIWMDVQGYEAFVLLGAEKTISMKPPCVMEFWPYGMKRAQAYERLKESIAVYDFFYDLREKYPRKSKISELDNLYLALGEDGDFTDILIV